MEHPHDGWDYNPSQLRDLAGLVIELQSGLLYVPETGYISLKPKLAHTARF